MQKEPLQDLTASFVLEGKKLAISRADVQVAGLSASFKGSLTESGVDVTFNTSVSGSGALPLPPGTAFPPFRAQAPSGGPGSPPR